MASSAHSKLSSSAIEGNAITIERRPSGRSQTTIQFLFVAFFAYLAALGAVAYFTRPVTRRIMGAIAGGVASGLSLSLVYEIADTQGWWRRPFLSLPGAPLLTFLDFSVSYAAIALIGWRIDRRFGWRGIACSLAAVCVIGSQGLRDRIAISRADGVRPWNRSHRR